MSSPIKATGGKGAALPYEKNPLENPDVCWSWVREAAERGRPEVAAAWRRYANEQGWQEPPAIAQGAYRG